MKSCFLLCFLMGTCLLTGGEKISFSRLQKAGEHFQCNVDSERTVRCAFRLQGQTEPVVRLETAKILFRGFLTVMKVNSAGNPLELRIYVNSVSGTVNGKPVKFSCSGKIVTADLSGTKPIFSVNGKAIETEESALFSIIFQPAGQNNLADLTGKEHDLPRIGGEWQPNTNSLTKILSQRKLTVDPAKFKGNITYLGSRRIEKKQCHKFRLHLETSRIAGYDFRLRLTFHLPQSGPPLYIARDATEILHRRLNVSNPLAAGSQITMITYDRMEQWMIPVRTIPVKRQSEKTGTWNDLLH